MTTVPSVDIARSELGGMLAGYCALCGTRLETSVKFSHYDRDDGQRVYSSVCQCPNKAWVFDKHHSEAGEYYFESDLKRKGWL